MVIGLDFPIEINGMKFKKNPYAPYKHDYVRIWESIQENRINNPNYEWNLYRELFLNDLWFVVFFALKVPIANNPFVVRMCNMVQDGPTTNTMDIWAREHFKSTIITIADNVRLAFRDKILYNIDSSSLILSYSEAAARKFVRAIKTWLEGSVLIKGAFPDLVWDNPRHDAPKWSEDEGLILRRDTNFKEATFEASGLVQGMKTGGHYRRRIYDDVETMDIVQNPKQISKLIEAFDMSENLGIDGGEEKVIGTYYHHEGLLVYLENKLDVKTQNKIYITRKIPATEDGSFSGKSVFLSEERLNKLRSNKKTFASQQLLNPSDVGTKSLNPHHLIRCTNDELSQVKNLYKFMAVDPAGIRASRLELQDNWAMMVVGVKPYRDDYGFSEVYILDMIIEHMDLPTALKAVVEMYLRNGMILKLGVERTGISTMDLHVSNALLARGVHVSEENGRLVALTPKGRSKEYRIESNLATPLQNGKIKYSERIAPGYIDTLKTEMERFPVGHDDGIDTLAYVYDMIAAYKFPSHHTLSETFAIDRWTDAKYRNRMEKVRRGWQVA